MVAIAAAALTGSPAAADQPAGPARSTTPKLTAIRAFPYFHGSGALGTRDLVTEAPEMNLPDVEDGSVATLVQVEVEVPDPINPEGVLQVDVLAGKKKLLSQKNDLRPYRATKSSKRVLPFFLYDTGCQPLTITAKLTYSEGKAQKTQKKSATVDFKCGE